MRHAHTIRRHVLPAALALSIASIVPGIAACDDPSALLSVRAAAEAACATSTTRGEYLRCVVSAARQAIRDGSLPPTCGGSVVRCARQSTFGKDGAALCGRVSASGRGRCRVTRNVASCDAVAFSGSCCEFAPTPAPHFEPFAGSAPPIEYKLRATDTGDTCYPAFFVYNMFGPTSPETVAQVVCTGAACASDIFRPCTADSDCGGGDRCMGVCDIPCPNPRTCVFPPPRCMQDSDCGGHRCLGAARVTVPPVVTPEPDWGYSKVIVHYDHLLRDGHCSSTGYGGGVWTSTQTITVNPDQTLYEPDFSDNIVTLSCQQIG